MNDQDRTMNIKSIRKNIDHALGEGNTSLARALLAELWSAYPGPASAPLILSAFDLMKDFGEEVNFVAFNVCVLRSFLL